MVRNHRVVAITNNKGGVGKTFLALHIAYGLKNFHNRRVVVVDTDIEQADAVKWATQYKVKSPEVGKVYKGAIDIPVIWKQGKEAVVREDFDGVVVVDGRPNIVISGEGYLYSDVCIFPVEGKLSMENLKGLVDLIAQVRDVKYKIVVVNKYDSRTRFSKLQFDMARILGMELFPIGITESVRVKEAEQEGITVWNMKKRGRIMDCLKSLIDYINDKL